MCASFCKVGVKRKGQDKGQLTPETQGVPSEYKELFCWWWGFFGVVFLVWLGFWVVLCMSVTEH